MNDFDSIRELMEEVPHGENHGARSLPDPEAWKITHEGYAGYSQGKLSNNSVSNRKREYLLNSGFSVVETNAGTHTGKTYGYRDAGMVTHRGVLHPDEYVNHDELIRSTERHFGFSFDDVRSVYTRAGGPLPKVLRVLRKLIDARLLELHRRDEINLLAFAEVLGLTEQSMHRALQRARKEEVCSS